MALYRINVARKKAALNSAQSVNVQFRSYSKADDFAREAARKGYAVSFDRIGTAIYSNVEDAMCSTMLCIGPPLSE